jgi:hypothetical protein
MGHNLGKDLARFVSGDGCQVFHGISGFWVRDACITGSVIVWLPEENPKRTIRYQRPTPPVPATYADVRLPEVLLFEYLMLVSLGAWLCGCPGTGFSFWSVVLRFPLHPMLDRLTHFHHWLVSLVACLVYRYPYERNCWTSTYSETIPGVFHALVNSEQNVKSACYIFEWNPDGV